MAEKLCMAESTKSDVSMKTRSMSTSEFLNKNKGTFKWEGDFESLKNLFDELFNAPTKWTSPGGNCKQCEQEGIIVRWYPTSESLILKGEIADKVESRLLQLMEAGYEDVADLSQSGELAEYICENEAEEDAVIHNIPSDNQIQNISEKTSLNLHDEPIETSHLGAINHETAEPYSKASYFTREIREDMNKIEARLNKKIDMITEVVLNAKSYDECAAYTSLTKLADRLEKENGDLKDENLSLRELNTKLSNNISELNAANQNLENEKASLQTALRILNSDLEKAIKEASVSSASNQENVGYWHTAHNKNVKATKMTNAANRPSSGVLLNNTYTVLHIEDDEEISADDIKLPTEAHTTDSVISQSQTTSKDKHKKTKDTDKNGYKQTARRPAALTENQFKEQTKERQADRNNKTRERPSIAILGDSMIKHLDKRRLQYGVNKNINIKTFPGAKTQDMMYYTKPTLATKPDAVIIHVGTNDIKNSTPEKVAELMLNLGKDIKKDCGNVQVIFSSIITRTDDLNLNVKINCCNKLLDKFCSEQCWGLINNNNLGKDHLNNYGLHLNKSGSALLARNIKDYLNRN